MSSTTDQIKAKLDIVSVVGNYLKLEKTGSNFKARCPFHNEKTPSFFVSPDRGSFYCFGCQAKGDIFTFVQDFEGLDFPGALKILADRAGVELTSFRSEEKSNTSILFSILEQATFYFEKNLSENEAAREYLASRGVTEETIKHFRIGYALAEWRGLHDFLYSKGTTTADMLEAGLIKKKDDGGFYDTFRSRIIFPIADSSGRIVAFSGRIFEDSKISKKEGDVQPPKYLNSPETPVFHKSEILYGLDKAKGEIHSWDYSILVEGQMDLIMLHQIGFRNTTASSGTALTEKHLERLNRLSHKLIMAFDGDTAGFKAITRGAEIALSFGMEVKVAAMPEGNDPADMAVQDKDGLVKIIKNSKHIISFVLDMTLKSESDQRVISRKVVSDVLPFVSRLQSASEKSYFVKEISSKTGIREEAIWEDVRKIQNPNVKNQNEKLEIEKDIVNRSDLILRKLVGILFWQKEKLKNNTIPDIDVDELEKKISDSIGTEFFNLQLAHFKTFTDSLLFEAEAYYSGRNTLTYDIIELVDNLTYEKLRKKQAEIMFQIQQAEAKKDSKLLNNLSIDFNTISKQIHEMKHKTPNSI